jgi:hypothetical protein
MREQKLIFIFTVRVLSLPLLTFFFHFLVMLGRRKK